MTQYMKLIYHIVKHEVYLTYRLMRSNVDAAFVPFPIFTTASLLYRGAELDEILHTIAHAIGYGFLFAYTIDLANNAEGSTLEDEINKPDRPIVSKLTTINAIRARYYISSGIWLIYSHFLNVKKWAVTWVVTVLIHYGLHAARFGPMKDICMTIATAVQLMACWEIGGSDVEVGWSWVKLITMWAVPTVPIQDFRDVPGDIACGRRTTPILLGVIPGICVPPGN
ncbi:uncharacterized protein N7469_003239 [Penicillium citrinum]|uniref:Uncharacterized protein n=1 Tax=Penicillium citrinum TaxID=5077 RepID=A0A9W9PE59_PENCI|nr:uncharacterized protein N7469_003239 [Penicillium citrinum]KAJ5241648.1 hypothetical protein N7469_003239 [Penicillium citrinum]